MKEDLTSFFLSAGLIILPLPFYFTIAGAAGCSLSAVNVISELMNKRDTKIFTNCGLINKDKVTPIKVNKNVYSIPSGLSYEDIKEKENELSTAFKTPFKSNF